jgi:hypothetical protein
MKKSITLGLLCLVAGIFSATAQVSINTDGSAPDSSAMLDVQSTSKGILMPRLTIPQIVAIQNPAVGLEVYCSTLNLPLFFNGTSWVKLDGNAIRQPGTAYEGGIVFYIIPPGFECLIVGDWEPYCVIAGNCPTWGCQGTLIGTSNDIGSGNANTAAIIAGCPEQDIAARICDTLNLNFFSDWFLPSDQELKELFLSKCGGPYSTMPYWTSSEANSVMAKLRYFDNGTATPSSLPKSNVGSAFRCIRRTNFQ